MMRIQPSNGGLVIRSLRPEEDFSLGLVDAFVAVGGPTAGSATVRDVTYATALGAQTRQQRNVVFETLAENAVPQLASVTPEVCSVTPQGVVTGLQDGTCRVHVRVGNTVRESSQVIAMAAAASTTYTQVTGFVPGSLRAALRDQQVAALQGVAPGAVAQQAFTGAGAPGPVNAANFLFTSKAGYTAPPAALLTELLAAPAPGIRWRAWVTPHHYLTWVGHTNGPDTATRRFIGGTEMVVEYSATPWAGAVCKLFNLVGLKAPPLQPGFAADTQLACWARLRNTYGGSEYWVQPVGFRHRGPFPAGDPRTPFQRVAPDGVMATGGDSGSPVFALLGGEVVIVSHVQVYSYLGSVIYGDYIAQLNAAIAELNASGSFTVQTVDLAAFPNY